MFFLSGIGEELEVVCLLIRSDGEVELSQYDFCHAGNFRSWRSGWTCEGCSVVFLSSCALWNRCCSNVEGSEFGSRNVCEGGAASVVEMSRRFSCVLVRVVDVFVELSVLQNIEHVQHFAESKVYGIQTQKICEQCITEKINIMQAYIRLSERINMMKNTI